MKTFNFLKSNFEKKSIFSSKSKLCFIIISAFTLALLQFLCKDAGISGDEEKHRLQAKNVYNFYVSMGKDTSALNYVYSKDPMQFNGQSFDLVAYCAEKIFNIQNVFEMRHHLNAFVGWLIILFTGIIVKNLLGYGAGNIAMLFLFISPFFLGHSFNNNKDIPFALGIIMSIYAIIIYFREFPKVSKRITFLLIFSIAFSISIRIAGILAIVYFAFFAILFAKKEEYLKKENTDKFKKLVFKVLLVSILGYFLGILLWPYALMHPLSSPFIVFNAAKDFPLSLGQIFEGKFIWSDQIPWYYLLKYISITIPLVIIIGFALFIILSNKIWTKDKWFEIFLILFSALFPVIISSFTTRNDYGGWRHFLFIYPSFVICTITGYYTLIKLVKSKLISYLLYVLMAGLSIAPIIHIIRYHPVEYVYYNEISGGVKKAYTNYEMDYFQNSPKLASEWLLNYIKEKKHENNNKIIVAANCSVRYFFRNDTDKVSTVYYKYGNHISRDWDYMIVCNTYINPFILRNNYFPPDNTIHQIKIDDVPICVVVERKQKFDYQASIALKNKDVTNALNLYNLALSIEPKNIDVLIEMFKCLYMVKDWKNASGLVDYALSIYPNNPDFLNYKGVIYKNTGNLQKAIYTFQNIIENVNPEFYQAYSNLGNCSMALKDYEKAIFYFRKCIEINEEYREAYMGIAYALRYINREEEAREYFKKASN